MCIPTGRTEPSCYTGRWAPDIKKWIIQRYKSLSLSLSLIKYTTQSACQSHVSLFNKCGVLGTAVLVTVYAEINLCTSVLLSQEKHDTTVKRKRMISNKRSDLVLFLYVQIRKLENCDTRLTTRLEQMGKFHRGYNNNQCKQMFKFFSY
jgi:hypothetical protein